MQLLHKSVSHSLGAQQQSERGLFVIGIIYYYVYLIQQGERGKKK